MGKWIVKYEDWSKDDLKQLGDILNGLMTTLDRAYGHDKEEASWVRIWETDMIKLINEVSERSKQ